MYIRAYEPKDLAQVQEIHRQQKLGYEFPKIDDPTYFIKIVGEQDGQIVQAAFAHLTAEIYFLLKPGVGTPQERHLRFLEMQQVGRELAWKPGGLDHVVAFLPPQLERAFGKRLMVHGWKKAMWPCYTVEVKENA